MITEVVTFQLPAGMTREQATALFRKSVPAWKSCPDLIRKNYLYDAQQGVGGGVYLWQTLEQAKRWHGEDFRKRIKDLFGSEPQSVYYETPIVVDNAAQSVVEESVAA